MKKTLFRSAASVVLLSLSLFAGFEAFAQEFSGEVRGTVKDQSSGEVLVGANILVIGTSLGTTTNYEGTYRIKLPPGQYSVVARYVGYISEQQSVTVTADQTTEASFNLKQDVLKLDVVVVTGISGEIPRSQLGNSISKIAGDEIAKIPVTNPLDALAGRAPGVQVTKATGTPGTGTYILLRGRTTITGSSQPLYVIDGVPIDNSFVYNASGTIQNANRATDIDPNDVESVEILKGASAAAIYGSRAASGVVLITTKSGKQASPGKFARISYSSSYSWDDVYGSVPLQSKYGQRTPYVPYLPGSTDSWGALLPAGTQTYDHSTDIFKTGHLAENSIQFSGGSPVFRYLASAAFTNHLGVARKSEYNRRNLRLNLNYSAFENVGIQSNSNYISSLNNLPQDGSNTSGILLGALRSPPEFNNLVYLEADGVTQRRFAAYDNPIWTMEKNTYDAELSRFIHNTRIDYDVLTGLRLTGSVSWDRYGLFNFQRLFNDAASTTARAGSIAQNRYTTNIVNTDLSAIWKHQITPDILFSAILGQQLLFDTRNYTGGSSSNTLPFYDQIGSGITKDAASSRSESRIYSYYLQTTGNAFERYTLTLSLRRDAGSNFGSADRIYYYPKASFAYRLSEEPFVKELVTDAGLTDIISDVKVRGAWGVAGTQPGTYATNFLYLTGGFGDPWGRGTSAGRSGQIGIRHSVSAGNSGVQPEKNEETEFGFDAAFWDRRVNLEFSYYYQNITNLLLFVTTPASTGYTTQLRNAGAMRNKGYELKLDVNPIRMDDFQWVLSANYAQNRNKVRILDGFTPDAYITLTGAFAGIFNVAKEGKPLGMWYGLGWDRDAQGNIVYSSATVADNVIGAGVINAPRWGSGIKEIGNSNPGWTGSLRSDFTFMQDWTLSVLFDAVWDFDVWNGTRGAMYNFGTHKDTEDRDDLWFNDLGQPVIWNGTANRVIGTRTYAPGEQLRREVYYRYYANGFNINEPHIEDGSFIKLRDVSLTYRWRNIPMFDIESIVFTFSGRNLITWSDYSGYDPEVNTFQTAEGRGYDYFTLPQVRTYRFGITINY